jgi:uncharacterized protein
VDKVSVLVTHFSEVLLQKNRRMKAGASNPTELMAGPAGDNSQARHSGRGREPMMCGDLDMRIAKDGTWSYQGSPITRLPLVKLFASVLRREDDGTYWLVTPAERGRIIVEDAPFVAVEVSAEGRGRDQQLIFRTNIDEIVTADGDHPLRSGIDPQSQAPHPYILVRDRLEARILRSVYYHLVALGEEEGDRFGVWSSGLFFPLGSLNPAP